MFRIFDNRTKEERLCENYSQLMRRAYTLALTNKKESDKINDKAKMILKELRRMRYPGLEPGIN